MDQNGHVPINPVRPLVPLAEEPLGAEQFAAASRPYSSQPEPYHTGGASLVAEMMMHELQRVVRKEKVQKTLVYDNQIGSIGPGQDRNDDGSWSPVPLKYLRFESRFETGNLRAAARVYDTEYDLWLSTDVNEREEPGHRQWFFFSVCGAKPDLPYKFNIVNLVKKDSLVNSGLCPLMALGLPAAVQRRDANGEPDPNIPMVMQWRRMGNNCCYYPSPYRSPPAGSAGKSSAANSKSTKGGKGALAGARTGKGAGIPSSTSTSSVGKSIGADSSSVSSSPGHGLTELVPTSQLVGRGLHCHTFTVTFDTAGTYYLAACLPYTYTDLQEHLARVTLTFRGGTLGAHGNSMVARCSLLCRTISKHRCDLLTITDFSSGGDSDPGSREYIVITARVHPGESNSSWVMKGMIDFLTSQHPTARSMRQSFIFKIVPCLNPDGVINGNYRCGMGGVDLNRTWDKPDKTRHPTVWHTRALVQRLASTGRLALFCDLHGHSRREDAFFYGCDPPAPSGPEAKAPILGPVAQREEAERAASRESANSSSDGTTGASRSLTAREIARLRVRMLPYLMAKIDQGASFSKCNFKVAKCKMSTGRVVVCRQLRVAGSYTLETSLGGCSKTGMHFGAADLMRLGRSLCQAIAELSDADEEQLLDEMAAAIDFGRNK
mmetsp:Transcript_9796/g.28021  ORF Transcript_9796/g.28021 Transcript_9796/m.28021 type:complete len:662 (-) Transcript_9796:200-2185(-)